jgi:hypothetical protein
MNEEQALKWYEYSQNNTGGTFILDDGVAKYVFIQATSPEEANTKAEEIGIYFYGVLDGRDCECCGDRWYKPYESSTEKEMDERIKNGFNSFFVSVGEPIAHKYYADGKKETVKREA